MYASFRWARRKNHVLKTTALIITLSFLSTVGLYVVLLFPPLPFLSFPFYYVWAERRLELPRPLEYSNEVVCFDICFVTIPVFLFVPQGPATPNQVVPEMGWVDVVSYRIVLLDTEIGAVPPDLIFFLFFLFFIVVNASGSLLGFLMSKMRTIEKTKLAFRGQVATGIVILAFGILLFAKGTTMLTGPWSKYYHSYPTYPPHYYQGAIACIIFGISWLVMILLDRARVFSRICNYFTQP